MHSSTELCLQCPIFEHDLQQYHIFPIVYQHYLSIYCVFQRKKTNVDRLMSLSLNVSTIDPSSYILHNDSPTATVDKYTGSTFQLSVMISTLYEALTRISIPETSLHTKNSTVIMCLHPRRYPFVVVPALLCSADYRPSAPLIVDVTPRHRPADGSRPSEHCQPIC